jgi:uncharacterized pyridoxal phosphate-containing UPF0001 family protein
MQTRNIADISKEAIQIADILSDFTCKYTLNTENKFYTVEHQNCIIECSFVSGPSGHTIKVKFLGIDDVINLTTVMTRVEMSYLLTIARVRKDTEAHNKRLSEINNSKQKFGEAMRARFNIK